MSSASQVIGMVSLALAIDPVELLAVGRTRRQADARGLAGWLMYRRLGLTTMAIGAIFNRDHTSAIYSMKKIEARIKADPVFAALARSLESQIALAERREYESLDDTLALVRLAAVDRRYAIGLSAMQITRACHLLANVWEIAVAAEALAKGEVEAAARPALERAVIEEMAELRGLPDPSPAPIAGEPT